MKKLPHITEMPYQPGFRTFLTLITLYYIVLIFSLICKLRFINKMVCSKH